MTCLGFLKPSLVGMRTRMGKPYFGGRTSPSYLKVSCVCGCSAVAISMELEYPSAQVKCTYLARVSAPIRRRNSRSGVPVHFPIALQPSDAEESGNLRLLGQRVEAIERPWPFIVALPTWLVPANAPGYPAGNWRLVKG